MSIALGGRREAVLGKFLLDSISVGLYTNPLTPLREYIQNSADAIDELVGRGELQQDEGEIRIHVDGRNRSVCIIDNGCGVPIDRVQETLYSLGWSFKDITKNRGFRGIGRLAGLGHCDRLRFQTKARGDTQRCLSVWDAKKLKALMNSNNGKLHVAQLLQCIVDLELIDYPGNRNDHFFQVELQNVFSSRDALMDVPLIKRYVSEVAPVPFSLEQFRYGVEIESRLKTQVRDYRSYRVFVNDEQIFKPYRDLVPLSKSRSDTVRGVSFTTLRDEAGAPLGVAWYADLGLLGTLNPSSSVDGVGVRLGNMLIGDRTLMSGLFREPRFNSYLMGEIHVLDGRMLPNARRDGFEDGQVREAFFAAFAKEIGLPISRRIRGASKERSRTREKEKNLDLMAQVDRLLRIGIASEIQRDDLSRKLCVLMESSNDGDLRKETGKRIAKLAHAVHIVDRRFAGRPNSPEARRLRRICDTVYRRCPDSGAADDIIREIVKKYR